MNNPFFLQLMCEHPLCSTVDLWTLICQPWSVNPDLWTTLHISQLIWKWPLMSSRCSDLWMTPLHFAADLWMTPSILQMFLLWMILYILQLICEHPLIFYSWYVNSDLWTTLHILHLICEQPLIIFSRYSGSWMTPLCLLYLQLICEQPLKCCSWFVNNSTLSSF